MPSDAQDSVVTIQQLIDLVESLKPQRALQYQNADSEFSCSTGVLYRIELAGRLYPLSERGGRIGAGYVRVSTEGQRQDGFSAEDQVFRIASYFAERGEAFRIFSDAGLSGTIPINDPILVQRVWNKKAFLYKELFERVFLTNTENKYTASDRALMRLFVEDAYERIRAGEEVDNIVSKADDVSSLENASIPEEPLKDDSIDAPKAMSRKSVSQKRLYRPGLTLISDTLSRYHTIAITDLSRLSRSQLTFGELHDKFSQANVEVIGLVESLAWMNDREGRNEVGSQIQALLLPMFAEHKVRESTLGVLRAIATRFDSKQPHGKIPTWLKRNADGTVGWGDPKYVEGVREMVRLYRFEGQGLGSIAARLTEKGYRTERGKPYPIVTVGYILNSRALCGQQVMFGRPWDVFPAILSVEEFEEMQQYRAERAQASHIRGRPAGERYLLSERFRCPCGRAMKHRMIDVGEPYHFWSCRATATEKRTMEYQGPHPSIPDSEIQRFFGELLGRFGHVVIDNSRTSREEANVRRELNTATERLHAVEADYAATRRSATESAERQAKADGISEDNPFFVQFVQIKVAALTNRLREEVSALKQRVSDLTDALAQLSAQRQTGGIAGQMSRWDTLTATEKNGIVKAVFRMVQFTGTVPNEALELELANAPAGSLPPVPVIATVASRGGGYARKLPSVQEWLEEAFAGEGFDVADKTSPASVEEDFVPEAMPNPPLM